MSPILSVDSALDTQPPLVPMPSPLHGSCLTPRKLMTPAQSPLPTVRHQVKDITVTDRLFIRTMQELSIQGLVKTRPIGVSSRNKLWLSYIMCHLFVGVTEFMVYFTETSFVTPDQRHSI